MSSASMPVNPLGLKFHHITARVRDIARVTAWYRDVLGFEVGSTGVALEGAMHFAHLHLPGFHVSFVQLSHPALEIQSGQPVLPSWVHVVFAVADPDALYRRWKREGRQVSVRGGDAGRVDTFLLFDSEGNELEIVAGGAT
jgi:catechol 2,3-dioxygenase-like lactoylglutathione lyase family enzyme